MQADIPPTKAPPDLSRLTLAEASELVRQRHVAPVELTKAFLARIERLNPVVNAFITVTAEQALEQARQAQAEIGQGLWRGRCTASPLPSRI